MSEIIDFNAHYRAVKARIFNAPHKNDLPQSPALSPPKLTMYRPMPQPEPKTLPFIPGNSKMRAITLAVVEKHGLDIREFVSGSRKAPYVIARHELFYELCELTRFSQARVGRILGMDHTSIRHGYNKHKAKLEAGDAQRLDVPDLQLRSDCRDTDPDDSDGAGVQLGLDARGAT